MTIMREKQKSRSEISPERSSVTWEEQEGGLSLDRQREREKL